MNHKLAAALVSAAIVCAPPTFADVTAREVVDLFQELAHSAGLTVEYANERTEPNLIVLEDVKITFPQDGAVLAIEPEWLRFAELDGGAVAITIPEEVPISETGDATSAYSGNAEGMIASSGYKTLVDRTGGTWTISSAAESATTVFEETQLSTTVVQDDILLELEFSSDDIALVSAFGEAAGLKIINIDRLEASSSETEIRNLRWAGEMSGTIRESGPDADDDGLAPELVQFSFDSLEFSWKPLPQGAEQRLPQDAMPFTFVSKDSEFSFRKISPQETAVNFGHSGTEFKYGGVFGFGTGPVGISLRYFESFDADDDEFNIDISLNGLALRDEFLDILDRPGNIPRDPGSFNAKATMNFGSGWLDEFLAESETWNETDAQNIERLLLQGVTATWAGATVDVTGDMRFEATADAEGNMSLVPVGDLDVHLDGVLALLDMFVEAGAIRAADAAGLRVLIAGMGMPAPEKADSYLFHLDFQPGGQTLVNGNPSPF